ncbi:unnamed protein product, partial [Prorocentrum cordatum]
WRPPERSQNRELTHRFPPAARSQLGGRPSSSCIELGMAGAAKIAARARLAPHASPHRPTAPGEAGGPGGGRRRSWREEDEEEEEAAADTSLSLQFCGYPDDGDHGLLWLSATPDPDASTSA